MLTIKFSNVILIALVIVISTASGFSDEETAAVERFRDYLRINTAYPLLDFEPAIQWIQQQAESIGLTYHIVTFNNTSNGFVIWLTWLGSNPQFESVFLYSHMDVVGVDSAWTHDPFEAEIDVDGNIYGRGSQDMKSAGIQYLEAIRNLKAKGFKPSRTIHVGFFPDEEVGGAEGIKLFVDTPEFKNLNIGLVLDEGLPNEQPGQFAVFNAQRTLAWTKFTALGDSGHGSLLLNNTAAEKITRVINKLLGFREIEKTRLEQDGSLPLGDVTTINLNVLEGGLQANVIPPKLSATFDMRFTPHYWNYSAVLSLLNETCAEAGSNVTYEFLHHTLNQNGSNVFTALNEDSWWWKNFRLAFASMNLTLVPRVFPAGTDGEVTRRLGIPTLGFSPIFNTRMLFHDRDEYLNAAVFVRGIEIYERLIQTLAYVPPPPTKPTTQKSKELTTGSAGTKGHHHDNSTSKSKATGGKSAAERITVTKVLVSIVLLLAVMSRTH